jgi:acyl dehydratase
VDSGGAGLGIVLGMSGSLLDTDFAAPVEDRYFEDYVVGSVFEYGYVSTTAEEIVAFAEQFDPQTMHVDPEAAKAGHFGGLIASGWHTTGLMMRLLAAHYISKPASIASPGIDELRWLAPVRPDVRLRVRTTVLETRRSTSKPDRGLVRTRVEMINSDDVTVLSLVALNLMLLRDPS